MRPKLQKRAILRNRALSGPDYFQDISVAFSQRRLLRPPSDDRFESQLSSGKRARFRLKAPQPFPFLLQFIQAKSIVQEATEGGGAHAPYNCLQDEPLVPGAQAQVLVTGFTG